MVLAGGLAIVIPFLADVVNLLGAFTLTAMCLIFPFAFSLSIMGNKTPPRERALHWCLVVMGVVAMVFCTFNAIYTMIHKKDNVAGTPAE